MIKVIKRNGKTVDFDVEKIEKAILYAMDDVDYEDKENIHDIVENIVEQIEDLEEDTITVEEIQEIVVGELYSVDRKLGKIYNDYRNEKNLNRDSQEYGLLSKDFLSKYKHLSDPFPTDMSSFVFYRTYSRFLPKENRRERWWEVVKRVVEYNCSLAPTSVEEAEKLYDNIYNLRQFPSGRSFWIGGTEVSKKYPQANFNCSFSILDEFDAFVETFYLLLIGAGVGYRVLPDDVDKLPKIRKDIEIIDMYYRPVEKSQRKEFTELTFLNKETAKITIGDSKEGWVQALELFLKLHYDSFYRTVNTVMIDYNNIRPAGEPLKTFGGTASGHSSMAVMLNKISKVIKNCNNTIDETYVKLKPIDCTDIANILGENVVSGGVRRTAEIVLFDVDDKEMLEAKNNLYTLKDGKWVVNKDIIHRSMSNNSTYYKQKPKREQLHWQLQQIRFSGEPAFINQESANKRRPNYQGNNACFTGDMRLLTSKGYKSFAELDGKNVEIININGDSNIGKVWCNGEKQTITLRLSNKKEITCTPDHVFMTIDEDECEAQFLKGKKIMPYIGNHKIFDDEYVKYGFIQGDGDLGRLKSEAHKGIEVNIGDKDRDIFFLFRNDEFTKSERKIYLQGGYKEKLIDLGFDSDALPTRKFPVTYDNWTILQKASFLQGCFSANGGVIKKYRVSYKTTSIEFALKLMDTLEKDFNIKTFLTTNKAKEVTFSNGTYLCKESYDVNISKYDSIQIFHNEINFYHLYKKLELRELLKFKAPYVMNILKNKLKMVYDFTEPLTHWGVVEGCIVHNCSEILLDNRGMCNLTEINIVKFIENGKLNEKELYHAQKLSARTGYRMTCVDFELHKWDYINKRDRLTGCSITGWQDAMNILKLSKEEQKRILNNLKQIAIDSANQLAEELGYNKPVLNTTLKPSGTISLLPNVSAGIHYSHSEYYIRRIRINALDPLAFALKEMGYNLKPEVGQSLDNATTLVVEFPMKSPAGKTKQNVTAIEQLENYKFFMENYVNHNVSITVTVRENEWDDVEQWLWDNWDEVIAVSFLPLSDAMYDLMPYEEINKEQYEELLNKTPKFNPSLISKYEKGDDFEIVEADCDSGICPVK